MERVCSSDDKGFWLNIIDLQHPNGHAPDVTLIPMVHLSDKAFQKAMRFEVFRSDIALVEGAFVRGGRFLRWIYNFVAGGKRLRLSVQGMRRKSKSDGTKGKDRELYPAESYWHQEADGGPFVRYLDYEPYEAAPNVPAFSRRVKHIRADLGPGKTREALRTIPLWFWMSLPIAALVAALFARTLSRGAVVDQLDKPYESVWDKNHWFDRHFYTFEEYVVGARDKYLRQILRETLELSSSKGKLICVQYGVLHMPQLLDWLLHECGYEVVDKTSNLAIAKDVRARNKNFKKRMELATERFQRRNDELFYRANPDY